MIGIKTVLQFIKGIMTNEIRIIFDDGCIGAGFVGRHVDRGWTMRPGLDNPQFKYVPSYATNLKETFRRAREEIQNRKAGEVYRQSKGSEHLPGKTK